jgi:uncharacterized protein (DUF488 family)
MQLATIGYEGSALTDFIATLLAAGIERVIDVREIAQSRRPGFSKGALETALVDANIDYQHIRQLGDPKHGRDAARAGDFELFRAIFTAHMDLQASQVALHEAIVLAEEKKSALMCFERNPKHCHRTIVADRMVALSSLARIDLGVQPRGMGGLRQNAGSADRLAGAC